MVIFSIDSTNDCFVAPIFLTISELISSDSGLPSKLRKVILCLNCIRKIDRLLFLSFIFPKLDDNSLNFAVI